MPEVTHTFAEKFTFNQHLSLPPCTCEDLLGKITVNQFTEILSYTSSLLSQIKDLFSAATADKHCALYFRSSLLMSALIAASHLLWPLLKGGSTSNCTRREMSASDLSEQFLPQVI